MTRPDPEEAPTGDAAEVWDAMRAVYRGFLAGDRAAVDLHLAPEVTIWDSAEPAMVFGLAELAQLRDRRGAAPDEPPAADQPQVADIAATEPVIDVWGDTALLRHRLVVSFTAPGPAPEVVRNTSVWRRTRGRWLAVHNHEDVLAPDGA